MLNKSILNSLRSLCNCSNRWYATKIKKSVLLQDTEKIESKLTPPNKIIFVFSNQSTFPSIAFKYPRSTESDRRVYVWGLSETGALGLHKSLKKQSTKNAAFIQHPTRLQFGEILDVVDVACGYGFSVFAVKRTDGISLFGTGINTDSQIGYHKHGGQTNKPMEQLIYPAPIILPKCKEEDKIQIKQCAAGRAHALVVSEENVIYSLGNNAYGQCGRPIVQDEQYCGSQMVHTISRVGENETIADVHCGQDHSLFRTIDGKVYACGWGADGQTGLGHYKSVDKPTIIGGDISSERIVKVAGTVDCVLALNDTGDVFGWGNSEYGQLECIDDVQQINSPQYISALKGIGKIIDIAAGGSYCLVLNGKLSHPHNIEINSNIIFFFYLFRKW